MQYFRRLIGLAFLLFTLLNLMACGSETGAANAPAPPSLSPPLLRFTSGSRCILHDRQGRYWIGSHQEGLAMWNGVLLQYFTMDNGLPGNQVRSLYESADGTIWADTDRGPCYFNVVGFTAPKIQAMPAPQGGISLKNYSLWFFAGHNAGALGYDGQNWISQKFPSTFGDGSPMDLELTAHTREPEGRVWLATYSMALGWDGQNYEIINDSVLGISGENAYMHIRSILYDSKGNLWMGNNGMGAILWRDGKGTFFSKDMGLMQPDGPKGGAHSPGGTLEHVFAIAEDQHGNIWFGDRDTGAWRYDGKQMQNFTVDPTLPSQHIWQIYQDPNGDLLFAMGQGGIYRILGERFQRFF